jgi:hypothetical protein
MREQRETSASSQHPLFQRRASAISALGVTEILLDDLLSMYSCPTTNITAANTRTNIALANCIDSFMPINAISRFRFRMKKAPVLTGAFILIAVFYDGFGARTIVVVILLDDRRTLCRLTLFDHGSTIPIPIPMAFAHGYACANGADPNADFFRQRRGSKGGYNGKYQNGFH